MITTKNIFNKIPILINITGLFICLFVRLSNLSMKNELKSKLERLFPEAFNNKKEAYDTGI